MADRLSSPDATDPPLASAEDLADTSVDEPSSSRSQKPLCRFYSSKKGCRAGEDCRFWHASNLASTESNGTQDSMVAASAASTTQSSQKVSIPIRENVRKAPLAAPSNQTMDPRAFQINQIKRRFKPTIDEKENKSSFTFPMKPTDPDFPYEIDELQCVLDVPSTWPTAGKPSLRVTNKDIPRGFQINIERGFESIVAESSTATLLGLMKLLDKQLEAILAGKKADTIVFVANQAPRPHPAEQPTKPQELVETSKPKPLPKLPPAVVFTDEQKASAQVKRQAHTRQLEARFGRLPSFFRSSDGFTYTLPLDSPKRLTWHASLRDLKTVRLCVPKLYPLEPCTIILNSDSSEAQSVEETFKKRQINYLDATLTQAFNYLVQNMREMSNQSSAQAEPKPVQSVPVVVELPPSDQTTGSKPGLLLKAINDDKPHVHVIARPPEWDRYRAGDHDSQSDSDSSDSDSDTAPESSNEQEQHSDDNTNLSAPVERGILLSFPHIELYGIELLQAESLDVTVKCERCKETTDILKLRNYDGSPSAMRQETCKKCAAILSAGFRADLIHEHSARAGYLDLDGCSVVDMLPRQVMEHSSRLSHRFAITDLQVVNLCRRARNARQPSHRPASYREVKFLHVSAAAIRASRATGRRKVKENLGITAGTPLPRNGRCSHYRKSNRWFRFSCCSKVFPCDRCHDAESDHPNEHANRMLCGFCSREQNYRPEDCGICHAPLAGKRGKGFWEGGKGTRDQKKMSRKDPRKYKRQPGSKAKG
ncbi:Hypothetical protein R9X50_00136300 [Acrodontium crateriforme]|uniref:CHY-type domain-containing protein n=1 Tax=Acrodontium crateriforme TaxID=150365 RepID=A0AAQ3LYX9_9PEZI|nr:Hypothetical protein R9X50_00136300 [Acrodontium crateriforme]